MNASELPAAVAVFQAAFAAEHGPRYGGSTRPSSFVEVWRFIAQVQPRGFLAARDDGKLVGYAIFVPSLRRLQVQAILRGAVLRWIWAALRGGFDLRPSAIARVLYNKVHFVRSGGRYRTKGDAQLLNVAVDPAQQGKGVAQRLVVEGLRAMREAGVPEVRLEVRPWNANAVHVYEKTGWRTVGRTKDLEGEWLVMVANP